MRMLCVKHGALKSREPTSCNRKVDTRKLAYGQGVTAVLATG